MSSSHPELSSSATTAVDCALSVTTSTPTASQSTSEPASHSHSPSHEGAQDMPTSSSKDPSTSNAPATLPKDAAAPTTSSTPDPSTLPDTLDSTTTLAARSAIMAHLSNVGSASLAPLSQRAADISAAHDSIGKQREKVDGDTLKLGKESARLEREAEKADDVLKDIGNVENWAQVLDRDLSVLEETLRIVEEEEVNAVEGVGEAEGGEGGTGDGGGSGKKRKVKGKEGWLWGLWQGKGEGS